MRSTDSGVRNSWLASSRKRCSRWSEWCNRSSIEFNVTPRRASSSSVSGTGSRRDGSASEMASASRRIRSTGRSAMPAANQPASDARSSAIGPPMTKAWSRRLSDSARSPSVAPTTT